MSGIAEILINQGFEISGSDLRESENTRRLRDLGAKISVGHAAENVGDADAVVYSSAVDPKKNPETAFSLENKIPTIRRAEMLAEIARLNYCLAIAGTHGKTTTTSMVGLILMKAGMDPTVVVGGRLRGLGGTNARLGNGEWTVVEADEYDRSFLRLLPTVALINNIEPEHLDIYKDYDDLLEAFAEFANKIPFYGFACAGLDDAGVKDLLPMVEKKVVTFGLSRNGDYYAEDLVLEGRTSRCVVYKRGEALGELKVNVPGEHNVKNALGALASAMELGVNFETAATAIEEFTGVYRRFEIKGEANGAIIVDDYAHHPTEIKETLKAARLGWKKRKIVCVFQPHTYSRTQKFYKEFGRSFDDADELIVTNVYPAREEPIEGVDGKLIADAAVRAGHKNVFYVPGKEEALSLLKSKLNDNDLIITMGAGDVWKIGEALLSLDD